MSHRLVIAVTGGGTESIPALFARPGASELMLEAVVPYQAHALRQFVGAPIESACSETTARLLAVNAFRRASELVDSPESPPPAMVGVGCTAALATNRQRRGSNRAHVVVHGVAGTLGLTMDLGVSTFSDQFAALRSRQETLTCRLILTAIERWGIDLRSVIYVPLESTPEIQLVSQHETASPIFQALLQGRSQILAHSKSAWEPTDLLSRQLILSGSFNPLHEGHIQMMEAAEQEFGMPATLELCIQNADKPVLDYLTIKERCESLRSSSRAVVLTRLPRFDQKAQHFPGSIFIIGADTAIRIADPRFYENDLKKRDAAIDMIASNGCRFYVVGRVQDGVFLNADALPLPDSMREICVFNPQFRNDISSTALRARSSEQTDG